MLIMKILSRIYHRKEKSWTVLVILFACMTIQSLTSTKAGRLAYNHTLEMHRNRSSSEVHSKSLSWSSGFSWASHSRTKGSNGGVCTRVWGEVAAPSCISEGFCALGLSSSGWELNSTAGIPTVGGKSLFATRSLWKQADLPSHPTVHKGARRCFNPWLLWIVVAPIVRSNWYRGVIWTPNVEQSGKASSDQSVQHPALLFSDSRAQPSWIRLHILPHHGWPVSLAIFTKVAHLYVR